MALLSLVYLKTFHSVSRLLLIIIVLIPKDKSIYSLMKVSFNDVEPTFSDVERTFSVVERTFNVAERNFLLGKSTFFPNSNEDFS